MYLYQRNSGLSWHEPSVKERIVNRFTIGQKHNTQKALFHLAYLYPPPNPSIGLDSLSQRRPDRPFDPYLLNDSAIWAATDYLKVTRELHNIKIRDFSAARLFCRITSW